MPFCLSKMILIPFPLSVSLLFSLKSYPPELIPYGSASLQVLLLPDFPLPSYHQHPV